jgi:hypothetical protein
MKTKTHRIPREVTACEATASSLSEVTARYIGTGLKNEPTPYSGVLGNPRKHRSVPVEVGVDIDAHRLDLALKLVDALQSVSQLALQCLNGGRVHGNSSSANVTDETRAGERGVSPFELPEMLSGDGAYDLGHIPRVVLWRSGWALSHLASPRTNDPTAINPRGYTM